jgi:hypothetical protein
MKDKLPLSLNFEVDRSMANSEIYFEIIYPRKYINKPF